MVRRTYNQTSFTSGELSPRMHGQIDFEKYRNGLEIGTNVVCLPHGPIKRRNGSLYKANATEPTTRPRLIRFQFDKDGDAFILEFSNKKIRFFRNGGQVTNTSAAIINGDFVTDISEWTDNSSGTGSIAFTTDHMDLVGVGAGNEARAYQAIITGTNTYTITVTTNAALTYNIGTTIGSSDIVTGSINGTAQTFQFTPATAGTVYIEFENPNSSTVELDDVSINAPAYEIDSPYTTAQLYEITTKRIDNTLYMAHGSHSPKELTRISSDIWTLKAQVQIPPPTYEAGESPLTTVTPGAATGLAQTFTSGAAAFLDAYIGREIQNLSGRGRAVITAVGSTTSVTVDIVEDFPSTDVIASGDWKMDLSPISYLTVTGNTNALSIVSIDSHSDSPAVTLVDTFNTTDVGRYISLHNGIVKITKRTDINTVEAQVLKALDDTAQTNSWILEDEAWDSTRGFPRTVGVFKQRLIYSSTIAAPQITWMSSPGLYNKFGVGADDADAIQVSVTGDETGQSTFIAVGRDLVIGTSGGEASYSGDTPSTISQISNTSYGSSLQNANLVDNEILFLQQSGKKIRSLRFFWEDENYLGDDLTFFVDHLTKSGIHHFIFAQEPDLRIHAITNDGDMLVGVYQRQQKTIGWTKWTTNGFFQSVNTIARGGKNEVWIVVKRTINGSDINYVELFDDGDGLSPSDIFMDAALKRTGKVITNITRSSNAVVTSNGHGYLNGDKISLHDIKGMVEMNAQIITVSNKTTNTFNTGVDSSAFTKYLSDGEAFKRTSLISGADHLEGESVTIITDGAKHANKTVSSGSVTLDSDSGQVILGLANTYTIKTLRPNVEIPEGVSQSQRNSIVSTVLRVFNSSQPSVNGTNLPARSFGDTTDTPAPLITGDLDYPLGSQGGWDNLGQITITSEDALPFMLLGLFSIIEAGAR